MSAVDFAVDVAYSLTPRLAWPNESITPTKYLPSEVLLGGSV